MIQILLALTLLAIGLAGFLTMCWITKKPEKPGETKPLHKARLVKGLQLFFGLANHEELLPLRILGYVLVIEEDNFLQAVDARTGTTYYVEATATRYKLWPVGKDGKIDTQMYNVVSISKAWLAGFHKPAPQPETSNLKPETVGPEARS